MRWQDWKYRDEGEVVDALLSALEPYMGDEQRSDIHQHTHDLVKETRAKSDEIKGFQSLMQNYDLSSEEGLALMCLAEALLRIPDSHTANKLIEDKISETDFDKLFGKSLDSLGALSAFGLKMSQNIMGSAIGRLGMPVIRKATIQAMRMMGKTFVLGRTIDEAIKVGAGEVKKGYVYSYDMLGEGARTFEDAGRYFDAYIEAIQKTGEDFKASVKGKSEAEMPHPLERPGVSIKLSALHPRYDFIHQNSCVPSLSEKLITLAKEAASYGINLTMDAEEADRLEISLDIFEAVLKSDDPALKNWQGYGLAVQAYQKRAFAMLDSLIQMARSYDRRFAVRLVKGAYWDTEIKHAQELGLPGYSVYTRKAHTDVSYLACAAKLLEARDHIYPMLGTHNAQTIAAILSIAGDNKSDFMFQRLHGMGEGLYAQILALGIPCNIYAPVGTHEDLLAYLVRRLLENGANSSFVYRLHNEDIDASVLAENPYEKALSYRADNQRSHPQIPFPDDIYGDRLNSSGMDLKDPAVMEQIYGAIQSVKGNLKDYKAYPVIDGEDRIPAETGNAVTNPANHQDVAGYVISATQSDVNWAFDTLKSWQPMWDKKGAEYRGQTLEKLADLMQRDWAVMLYFLQREAGKTYDDAVGELREAIDFCRYYAMRGRELFGLSSDPLGQELCGPTGEKNLYSHCGRGVFVCISPWNFPLAIYTGQIVAALMGGNAVAIKPAEQTPLIAHYMFNLMREAGVPDEVIAFLPGDGDVGAMLVEHKDCAGVAFTGSTEVARIINKTLADKNGPIVPLIAETGGQNAMIVDSSSLPEQVVDDVILSAFGSAGQRCSALRILCLQEDIADKVITMLQGAMQAIMVGDPSQIKTDIGPVIDEEARGHLIKHIKNLRTNAKIVGEVPFDETGFDASNGTFIAPLAAEIDDIDMLEREVFGPILHIVRYKNNELSDLIDTINGTGYGLTFGLHSRNQGAAEDILEQIHVGNAYVNRGMTGAVVGVQPFGGMGLSGTGPKAGGPYYLLAFTHERSISIDITASGGNASLVSLSE